jgi:hypothetical protein
MTPKHDPESLQPYLTIRSGDSAIFHRVEGLQDLTAAIKQLNNNLTKYNNAHQPVEAQASQGTSQPISAATKLIVDLYITLKSIEWSRFEGSRATGFACPVCFQPLPRPDASGRIPDEPHEKDCKLGLRLRQAEIFLNDEHEK